MSVFVFKVNDLDLQLVALDFGKGQAAITGKGDSTKNLRELAVIYLLAKATYRKVTDRLIARFVLH